MHLHNAASVCDCAGADFLRGVEVYRETVLEVVGDKPQKVEWPGYGFFIEVPEGAVPPGVTASVGVKVILAGQFKFPENSQLISAIYWVSSSVEFVKEVAVNIQHCAVIRSEDQCSQFKFIIAKCSQKELPYKFREREGLFSSHTQYGAIKLKQFSLLGETAPGNLHQHSHKLMRHYASAWLTWCYSKIVCLDSSSSHRPWFDSCSSIVSY